MWGQSVRKDLLFGLTNLAVPAAECEQRISEVAELLEITHLLDKRPSLLSGGEKRRVALAGVMVMQPSLIFLDEPSPILITRDRPGSLLHHRPQEKGATLIIATHEVEKVAAHCEQTLILDHGCSVLSGSTEEVLPSAESTGYVFPVQGDSLWP